MRDLPYFKVLWERRTVHRDEAGAEFNLMSIPDLVEAKKTPTDEGLAMIELLVAIHYRKTMMPAALIGRILVAPGSNSRNCWQS